MKVTKQVNPKLKYEFCEFRSYVLGWCLNDVWIRIDDEKKIVPTEEEVRMTTIWELIEPQVRDAVRELNRKGYCTTDSGFWAETAQYQKQFIEGLFSLDTETVQNLKNLDIYVENEKRRSTIWFYAKNPDFEEIKQTWNEIVDLIPDLGYPAKSRDEILNFNEDRLMKKLFEIGKITEKDYKTFKKNKKTALWKNQNAVGERFA